MPANYLLYRMVQRGLCDFLNPSDCPSIPHSFYEVGAMPAPRLFASHSDSFAGSVNKQGLRVPCGCGIVAALFLSWLTPAGMQAQTAAPANGPTSVVGSGFNQPFGVTVDGKGNVFVADYGNNAVKEIMAGTGGAADGTVNDSSTVTTVGSGFNNPQCVAVDRSGNVFVIDFHDNTVKEIVAGTGGAASGTVNSSSTVNTVGSGFNDPEGLAVDGKGDVFVADYGNSAVKEIVAGTGGAASGTVSSTSTVNTVGGNFSDPRGVAVDSSGDIFVADSNNRAVKEIVAVGGVVSSTSKVNTVGSGFHHPEGMAVDRKGNVFVSDSGKSVNGSNYSAVKEIVAGAGGVSSTSTVNTVNIGYNQSSGVAVDRSGNVFIAVSSTNAVNEIPLAR